MCFCGQKLNIQTNKEIILKENIILDVDTGIDDALAIIYAIWHKNAKVNLISCCHGNCSVESATQNTLNVINLSGRTEIPVGKGEEKPLLGKRDESISLHGATGLGEYVFPRNKVGRLKEIGIDAMRDAIMSAKGKTTIIGLGPLTNIAKLIYAYPKVLKKIKAIVISGGLLDDNKKKPYVGFNIAQDAYACEFIFNSKVKTIICPSDFGHQACLHKEEQDKLADMNESGKIFKEIFKFYKDRHVPAGVAATHDACAVASVLNPRLFKFEKRWVYLRKLRANGKSIIDFDANLRKKHIKSMVAVKMNIDEFKKDFYKSWKNMP